MAAKEPGEETGQPTVSSRIPHTQELTDWRRISAELEACNSELGKARDRQRFLLAGLRALQSTEWGQENSSGPSFA